MEHTASSCFEYSVLDSLRKVRVVLFCSAWITLRVLSICADVCTYVECGGLVRHLLLKWRQLAAGPCRDLEATLHRTLLAAAWLTRPRPAPA